MAKIRIKGIRTGDTVDISADVGAETRSVIIPFYRTPEKIMDLPRIQGDAFAGQTLTVDTSGLAGVTAYDWRIVGGATVATTAGFTSTMMQGGMNIEVAVTHSGGVTISPPWHIYAHAMGPGDHTSMMADDTAIAGLIPHDEITHLALADGDWTSTATWRGGRVPTCGAKVLIPIGVAVTYDEGGFVRLDSLRVDGVLETSLTKDTRLLVEHFVITRTGAFRQGTPANRMPANISTTVTISGRDYSQNAYTDTDMNLIRDPKLWGRGLINQGEHTQWGAEKQAYVGAEYAAAGATSIVLKQLPSGWGIGDAMIVTGSTVAGGGQSGEQLVLEDETRTITNIVGTTVFFDDPLVFDHTNQNPLSTRTDLPWHVKLRGGRNVILQSECRGVVWRRGHNADVHHHAHVDKWHAQSIGLGRTDKSRPVGKINAAGLFEHYDVANDPTYASIVTETPLTARSNLAGRYSGHGHHLGQEHSGHRPTVHGCYFEDSPGWLFSHHACDMDIQNCAFYDFFGAGLVAEQGDERGNWDGNIAGHTHAVAPDISLTTIPKIFEGLVGLMGDNFKQGTPFAFRGRAVKSSRNIAYSGSWAYTFFHRSHNLAVFPINDLVRSQTDLSEAGRMASEYDGLADQFNPAHMPILHFSDNINQGCHSGFFVTKGSPIQKSDVPIYLRNFVGWGHKGEGFVIEYVAHYNLSGFDLVGGVNALRGVSFGQNVYHSGIRNSRIEGHIVGIDFFGGTTAGVADDFDAATDPRFFSIGNDYQSNGQNITYTPDGGIKPLDQVAVLDDDRTNSLLDFSADPFIAGNPVVGEWTGGNNGNPQTLAVYPTNVTHQKVDNFGALGNIAPHIYADTVLGTSQREMSWFQSYAGYYQYGADQVVVQRDIIGDRATGRPGKGAYLYLLNTNSTGPDNGTFLRAATPLDQTDKVATVSTDGTVIVDVLAGATGAGGAGTYALDVGDHISPNHGTAVLDGATGSVTYTPDQGYTGTDDMYVFIESQGRFKTVQISFLVGPGGSVVGPTAGTNFGVADHGDASTIAVTLLDRPQTGGRRIRYVQYSTDGGATWARLTNHWPQGLITVRTASDGAAIVPGNMNLRLRYVTDFDGTTSAASADMSVTAT